MSNQDGFGAPEQPPHTSEPGTDAPAMPLVPGQEQNGLPTWQAPDTGGAPVDPTPPFGDAPTTPLPPYGAPADAPFPPYGVPADAPAAALPPYGAPADTPAPALPPADAPTAAYPPMMPSTDAPTMPMGAGFDPSPAPGAQFVPTGAPGYEPLMSTPASVPGAGPYGPPGGGYQPNPYTSGGTPPQKSSTGLAVLLIVIGIVVVLGLGGLIAWLLWPSGEGKDDARPAPEPTSSQSADASPAPIPSASGDDSDTRPDPTATDSGLGDPDDTTTDPLGGTDGDDTSGALTPTGVAATLQQLQNDYAASESSKLWDSIPRTKKNVFAAIAFSYIVTDMRSATRFMSGSSADTTKLQQYLDDAEAAKKKLLAQQPLGTDISIKMSNGKTFTYDGDTGEGTYK